MAARPEVHRHAGRCSPSPRAGEDHGYSTPLARDGEPLRAAPRAAFREGCPAWEAAAHLEEPDGPEGSGSGLARFAAKSALSALCPPRAPVGPARARRAPWASSLSAKARLHCCDQRLYGERGLQRSASPVCSSPRRLRPRARRPFCSRAASSQVPRVPLEDVFDALFRQPGGAAAASLTIPS